MLKKIMSWIKNFFNLNKNFTVFYIHSGENLPAPLSNDSETKFINMLGTDKNDEAVSELIEHNLRLVVYIARRFENTGVSLEDLTSIGVMGLIKAIKTFCKEKNIKLATYASRCIENELLMNFRKMQKNRCEVFFGDKLNHDCDGNELSLYDVLCDKEKTSVESNLEIASDKKNLLAVVNNLNNREREIIYLRYGLYDKDSDELTQKEVADILGISQSYISRLEKRIMSKLKKDFLATQNV
ncbi:MAG: sigma-70 family RNA polymerase sigma factor [Clostridiales bacterium]|jgi:RNA polymerase sporulation-specific sigma factor|nr:sigma-70 family RNA polymerase sigma factor [Clostridiales bacterium]